MALIIDGRKYEIPGVNTVNYEDDPRLALRVSSSDQGLRDGAPREKRVQIIVQHSTSGKYPQKLLPQYGPNSGGAPNIARYWSTNDRGRQEQSGAHLIQDHDGIVYQTADLEKVAAFHAGQRDVNHRSIGIELVQSKDNELYAGQLATNILLLDFLTVAFGIQRQYPSMYSKSACSRLLKGGADLVGIVGHHHVSNDRGIGDPGMFVYNFMKDAKYEAFNIYQGEDKDVWSGRQKALGILADGIPGPRTIQRMKDTHSSTGLYVNRPNDAAILVTLGVLH